jgi:hypothetical protein
MNKKSLVILFVLLVIVAGAIGGTIIFLEQQKAAELATVPTPSPTVNENLSDARYKTITYIRMEDEDSVIELTLNEDSVWEMSGSDASVDQTSAGSIATYLTYVYATQVVDIGDTPLSAYGLEPGDFRVTYSTSEGTYTNYYGKYTSDRSAVFFRKEGDGRVYTIDVEYFNGVKRDHDSLRDRSVNIPDIGKTGYVVFKTEGEPQIVLKQVTEAETYTPVTWVMTEPVAVPLTQDAAYLIIESLGSVSLTGFAGEEVKDEYGLDGQTWLEYRDFSGNVITRIHFGKVGQKGSEEAYDRFYCTVDGKNGVYLITRSVAQAAKSTVFSLIDQRLLPLDDFSTLDKLTMTRGEDTTVLRLAENEYTLDGEPLSLEQATELYNKTRTVNFVGMTDAAVDQTAYASIFVERAGFGGKKININIYPYLKDFYAVDYGSGPQLYVKAELLEGMLDFFFDYDPAAQQTE